MWNLAYALGLLAVSTIATAAAAAAVDSSISKISLELLPLPPGCNIVSGRRCRLSDGSLHPSVKLRESIPQHSDTSQINWSFKLAEGNHSGHSLAVAESDVMISAGLKSTVPKTITVAFAADDHYMPKMMAVVEQLRSMRRVSLF